MRRPIDHEPTLKDIEKIGFYDYYLWNGNVYVHCFEITQDNMYYICPFCSTNKKDFIHHSVCIPRNDFHNHIEKDRTPECRNKYCFGKYGCKEIKAEQHTFFVGVTKFTKKNTKEKSIGVKNPLVIRITKKEYNELRA